MAILNRPNSWVTQESAANTTLSYSLQLTPAPLTVSVSGRDPVLGSLEFVLTNPTTAPVEVNSVSFTLQVGEASSNITTSTATVGASVSDSNRWRIQTPGPITSGPAVYTLAPQTGSSVSLAAGASVVVEIYNFPTVTNPGNSVISIKENAGGAHFTTFQVSTFPTGFHFNSLGATVQQGSQLVPVAQVGAGAPITLIWNTSVVDVSSVTILYSDPVRGQRSSTPSTIGHWISPPLTADTVFTVVVTVSVVGGTPLTAALSTTVAVQNPSLVADSLAAGSATIKGPFIVTGATQANAITATGLTVNGATITGNLTASGTLSVPNQSNFGTVAVSNTASVTSSLRIEGRSSSPALSIGGVGTLSVDAPNVAGGRFIVQNNGTVGINRPNPGAALDINGNLAVSSGASISGGASVNGNVNLCPAPDASQGRAAIGGTMYSNVMLMVTNSLAGNYGVFVDSRNSRDPYWALAVHGPCVNTSGSWTRMSDLALKNRIHPYEDGMEKLLKINPIRYHYKEEMGLSSSEEQIGVVAQDLQEVAPYMVGTGKINPESNEEFLTINDSAMTYMLINAVKELNAKIEVLETELKTLQGK